MRTKPNPIKIIAIVTILIGAIVAGAVFLKQKNTPDRQVTITNLSSCAPKINSLNASHLRTNMYAFVERANHYNERENLPNYTAQIRDGSCRTETLNEEANIYSTAAILDIPEAKQSWNIRFSWTSNKGTPQTDLGTVEPTCLSASDLRYGDFKCVNVVSLMTYGTDKYDPILKYMPYDGSSFDLSYDPETKTISATVLVRPDEADNAALIENNKAAVPQWLTLKGLNPNNYTIKYRVSATQD